jgi:hypothetical protein
MIRKTLLLLTALANLTMVARALHAEEAPPAKPTPRAAVLRFVTEFIAAGERPAVIEAAYYLDSGVAYFDQGFYNRAEIVDDIIRYNARWPERRYALASDLDIHWLNDLEKPLVIVNFSVAYELHHGEKYRQGVSPESICITPDGHILAIANHPFIGK